MHSFEVHSNESTCRKSGRLGLDQVIYDMDIVMLNLLNIAHPIMRLIGPV